MSDEKKKAVCPCCDEAHVNTFPEMLKRWKHITSVVRTPESTQVVVGDALRLLLQDANQQIPTVYALLNHVTLAQFYYEILQTDINDLQLSADEHEQLEELLEGLWQHGQWLSDTLTVARETTLRACPADGTTLEAIFAAEVIARSTVDEGPDVGDEKDAPADGGATHNLLWWNSTGPRGQA